MAIVLFSMGGKAFSFGKPNVDSVVDRFLNQNAQPSEGVSCHASRHDDATVHQLNQQFHELSKRLKVEKKKEKIVQNMSNKNYGLLSCRFDAYVNQLDLQQLEQLKRSMVELNKNVAQRVDELNSKGSSKHAQEEEQVENTEINDNDVSTIPHDWLRCRL
ncbi:agamous-like MADS-box protein AGL62 [Camellia sinensis]|uniref:agamous-like MADS-box protein AGL62 n=1 Tax=Camellia sinensis TaxID=4442 RepID=UPI00103581B7|nr:agamous-like MADS-box protein AGL62 [Camellia sinensis]